MAAQLRAMTNLRTPDAIHAATAQSSGCTLYHLPKVMTEMSSANPYSMLGKYVGTFDFWYYFSQTIADFAIFPHSLLRSSVRCCKLKLENILSQFERLGLPTLHPGTVGYGADKKIMVFFKILPAPNPPY
ncbi:MAG: hypothetical protein SVX43_11485 [Cyanobacteriota bacterium]|nr:hypothetical protein [Cyanobacteriota bacterium]